MTCLFTPSSGAVWDLERVPSVLSLSFPHSRAGLEDRVLRGWMTSWGEDRPSLPAALSPHPCSLPRLGRGLDLPLR